MYTISHTINTSSEGLPDLHSCKYIYLIVDDYLKSNPSSFVSPLSNSLLNKTILARIPNNYNMRDTFGSTINFNVDEFVSDLRIYLGKSNLQRMKIELVNEFGKVINLNHMPFSFCMEVAYE